MLSLVQDLQDVHSTNEEHIDELQVVHRTDEEHTDKAKTCFISSVPYVRNYKLSINKPLNSLLTKFLRTDGLNHNYATRPSGDGLTNPSINNQCARIEETK